MPAGAVERACTRATVRALHLRPCISRQAYRSGPRRCTPQLQPRDCISNVFLPHAGSPAASDDERPEPWSAHRQGFIVRVMAVLTGAARRPLRGTRCQRSRGTSASDPRPGSWQPSQGSVPIWTRALQVPEGHGLARDAPRPRLPARNGDGGGGRARSALCPRLEGHTPGLPAQLLRREVPAMDGLLLADVSCGACALKWGTSDSSSPPHGGKVNLVGIRSCQFSGATSLRVSPGKQTLHGPV